MSIPSEILEKVITQRISDTADKRLRKEQAGFMKGRGCADPIFTLYNIVQQCTEWQRRLYINSVDFEKTLFTGIDYGTYLVHMGFHNSSFIIKSLFNNYTCQVGNSNYSFKVKTGLRQGCVMRVLLFDMVIGWVMRRTNEDQP